MRRYVLVFRWVGCCGICASSRGVNWRFRTGSPRRDVPERHGKWTAVYDLHRRYSENGTCPAILLGILADAEEPGEIDWFVSVRSQAERRERRERRKARARAAKLARSPGRTNQQPDHEPARDRDPPRQAPRPLPRWNRAGQRTDLAAVPVPELDPPQDHDRTSTDRQIHQHCLGPV